MGERTVVLSTSDAREITRCVLAKISGFQQQNHGTYVFLICLQGDAPQLCLLVYKPQ